MRFDDPAQPLGGVGGAGDDAQRGADAQHVGQVPLGDPFEVGELVGRRAVSYTHLRAHETVLDPVSRLLLAKRRSFTESNHSHPPTIYLLLV